MHRAASVMCYGFSSQHIFAQYLKTTKEKKVIFLCQYVTIIYMNNMH